MTKMMMMIDDDNDEDKDDDDSKEDNEGCMVMSIRMTRIRKMYCSIKCFCEVSGQNINDFLGMHRIAI